MGIVTTRDAELARLQVGEERRREGDDVADLEEPRRVETLGSDDGRRVGEALEEAERNIEALKW